ncbi:GNAT family N-acetyltransferase [Aeromicrobium sp. IC_218]|uniref:GNAT family N-acetyltransferase n=1 Tax=Aeromicrobium sp. IC_218 TaxID=2545468 RepID=UPI00103F0AA5|nr:GNAT family N-acetyltransferase [Aeromicrobium sp. IC_218]TCI98739.1 GNAT family N-acetyltransferase [Aeromicrobium sp. IC_218]
MTSPAVRPATPDDHPALVQVWRRAVEATHDFLSPADVDFYERAVTSYLPRMADLRVVDGPDGRPAGFVAQDDGEIHMLFVDPAVHGRGLGTRLLDAVAADQPVLRLDVNEQNESGRRFYAARGFTQVGRSPLDGEGRPFPLLHLRRG